MTEDLPQETVSEEIALETITPVSEQEKPEEKEVVTMEIEPTSEEVVREVSESTPEDVEVSTIVTEVMELPKDVVQPEMAEELVQLDIPESEEPTEEAVKVTKKKVTTKKVTKTTKTSKPVPEESAVDIVLAEQVGDVPKVVEEERVEAEQIPQEVIDIAELADTVKEEVATLEIKEPVEDQTTVQIALPQGQPEVTEVTSEVLEIEKVDEPEEQVTLVLDEKPKVDVEDLEVKLEVEPSKEEHIPEEEATADIVEISLPEKPAESVAETVIEPTEEVDQKITLVETEPKEVAVTEEVTLAGNLFVWLEL